MSAGLSLVLQPRPQEAPRLADQQLQEAGYAFESSMRELMEGFCTKLRRDLAGDVLQVRGGAPGHQDLEQFAGSIKAEVKTESAILLQEVLRLTGELRQQRSGPDAGAADLAPPELKALGEGVAEMRAAVRELQAVGPELADISQGFSEMRIAIRELRAAAVDLAGLRPQAGEAPRPDVLLEELRGLRAQHDAGVAEVLKLSREGRASLGEDLAEVARFGRESRAALLRELRDLQKQRDVEVGSVLSEVKAAWRHCPVDLTALLAEVRQLHSSLHAEVAVATDAVRDGLEAASARQRAAEQRDLAEVLRAVEAVPEQIDIAQVVEAVQAHRQEVDLSPVLHAVYDCSRPASECLAGVGELREALAAMGDGRLEVVCPGAVQEARQLQARVDAGAAAVLQAVKEGPPPASFSTVLDTVEASRTDALKTLLEEVEFKVDFSQVIQAVQKSKSQVDFSQVLRAIQDHKPEPDLSPVLNAISETRTALDSSESLKEIRQAVSDVRQGRMEIDFSEVAKELQQVRCQVDSGTASVLRTLQQGEVSVDLSTVMRSLEAIRKEMDVPPVLHAVHKAVLQALNAIQEQKPEVDFSQVLKAIHDCRVALDVSPNLKEISQAVAEIRQGELKLDLSAVTREFERTRSHLDAAVAGIVKAIEEGGPSVDCSKVGSAAAAVEAELRSTLDWLDKQETAAGSPRPEASASCSSTQSSGRIDGCAKMVVGASLKKKEASAG